MQNKITYFSPKSEKSLYKTAEIFREYQAFLGVDLCFQSFDNELLNLSTIYKNPFGTIILAKHENEIVACIALKPIENGNCEMKRLYVKPKYRGLGIGKVLVEKLIKFAKKRKYQLMKLDTLVTLKEAIALYQSFGFVATKPYVYNPLEEVLYFEKNLKNE